MNCKHCQAPLEDGNSVCPSCGWDNSLPEETETIAFSPEETAPPPPRKSPADRRSKTFRRQGRLPIPSLSL